MSSLTPPDTDAVLGAIRASGYPLEIRVARALRRRGYSVTPSWNFFDEASGRSRELDIVARKDHALKSGGSISFHTLVECKLKSGGVVGFRSIDQSAAKLRSYMDFDCASYHPEALYFPEDGGEHLIMYHSARVFAWGFRALPPLRATAEQIAFLKRKQQKAGIPDTWVLEQTEVFAEHLVPLCIGFSTYRRSVMVTATRERVPRLHFANLVFVSDGPAWVYSLAKTGDALMSSDGFTYYRHLELPQGAGVFRVDFVPVAKLARYLGWLGKQQAAVLATMRSLPLSLEESLAHMARQRPTRKPSPKRPSSRPKRAV